MSQTLTRGDVARIARLARLELTDEETTLFATQLSAILAYADQVRQVDTSSVADGPATSLASPTTREDEPRASLDRETVLSQAPAVDHATGLFKVPRVLGS